jgi:hypothetical protein
MTKKRKKKRKKKKRTTSPEPPHYRPSSYLGLQPTTTPI